MKAEELISSTSSMWTALVTKQVNRMAQRLALARPPRVLRETIDHGPNASTPTFVNGAESSSLSPGKLAIF